MKQLLNVLYVCTEGSYVSKQGETVSVAIGSEEKVRIPAHLLECIVCFGNTTVSTPLLQFCGERGIGLSFFSDTGRFYGRLEGPVRGNILLRRAQYALADDASRSSSLAWAFTMAKVANARTVLVRAARDCRDAAHSAALRNASDTMAAVVSSLKEDDPVDTIRGREGSAAAAYFGAFNSMIHGDQCFDFVGRSKHPPKDPINAILSFLYSLLTNDVRSALEGVGLDPAAGFLHTVRPGRPSLALDMMEELRSPLCDRLAVSLVNLKQLQHGDFDTSPTGARMSEKARRAVISAWQSRKKEEVMHPYLDEKVPIGLIPHLQAQLLARHIRGDIDAYPPFRWR